ncbi:hypothetical protein [Fodinibius sp.]|uniref:hypothetical protein n=1 Tax=Fodinibius sp. TaxID=1872440 RepID=UPI002ACD40C7|nr:hypothetical protein [Fodinibius sp.]MDZ7659036.1 hypothetical protein [Fodinibius sp.]
MDQRILKEIKRIYHSTKKEIVFRPVFERKLANIYPTSGSRKLRYEFRTIYRKYRDEQYSLKDYLKYMTVFTEIATEGNH